MNELDYLRDQVSLERSHMRELRSSFARLLVEGRDDEQLERQTVALATYLLFALRRLVLQDELHCRQLRERIAAAAEGSAGEHAHIVATIDDLERSLADARGALDRFEAAHRELATAGRSGVADWLDACRRFNTWYETQLGTRRHALGDWLDAYYTLADWRRASLVDAESVLEERRLYAAARAALASPPTEAADGR
jgi:hypothetical protein